MRASAAHVVFHGQTDVVQGCRLLDEIDRRSHPAVEDCHVQHKPSQSALWHTDNTTFRPALHLLLKRTER